MQASGGARLARPDQVCGSREALARFAEDPQAFDLVLTDVTMPHLTGAELVCQILTLRPEVPVLLCTGFSHVVSASMAHEMGLAGYLMKPISRSDLAQAIARALDRGL